MELLLIGGLAYLLIKGLKLGDTQKSLRVNLAEARIHQLDTRKMAVILIIRLSIDNPTGHALRMSHPYLEIFEGNRRLGGSLPEDRVYTLLPRQRTELQALTVELPLPGLIGTLLDAPQMIQRIQETGKAGKTLTVRTRITAAGLTVVQEDQVTL
ncbi:MAG: hypothetical protein KF690_11010 [Bacteroidetes bacterium]|nr:hypothetical protein [Bacteroidota bacterium]